MFDTTDPTMAPLFNSFKESVPYFITSKYLIGLMPVGIYFATDIYGNYRSFSAMIEDWKSYIRVVWVIVFNFLLSLPFDMYLVYAANKITE